MKRTSVIALVLGVLAGLLLGAGVRTVLTAPDSALNWSVVSGGGGASSSTNYALAWTAGQPSPIGQSQSTNYELGAGFWYGVAGCAADFDGDALCDPQDPDDDNDGCTDARENQITPGSQASGGLRNPMHFWDFMDQYTGNPLARDKIVAVGDIGAVVARFGTSGSAGGNPLTPPGASTGYHVIADRNGSIPGQDPWDLNPPNGNISVGDIGAVVAQFGHSCV